MEHSQRPEPPTLSVVAFLEETARDRRDETALIDEQGGMTYGELFDDVRAGARLLRDEGIEPGQTVGVMGPNGRGFLVWALAASAAGTVVVPMSPDLRPDERERIARTTSPAAVIHDRTLPAPIAGTSMSLGSSGTSAAYVLTRATSAAASDLVSWIPDAAFIRFTSGTTGLSKGVVLSHEAIRKRAVAAGRALDLSSEDRILWLLPMAYHFFVSIVLYLWRGCAIVLCPDEGADTILRLARERRATLLYASPHHYRLLADDESGEQLGTLRRALSTATGLPRRTAEAFRHRFGLAVTQAYGIIEAGMPLVNLTDAEARPESVGKAAPGYEARVVEDGRALPPETIGELHVRGPGMFSGYVDPHCHAAEIMEDGWFATGDLARQDADGLVTILGRRQSALVVDGKVVSPEEVEAALDEHPDVARSRVRASMSGKGALEAEVVLRRGVVSMDAEALLAHCRERLPAGHIPQAIRLVDSVDQTPSGKVSRGP